MLKLGRFSRPKLRRPCGTGRAEWLSFRGLSDEGTQELTGNKFKFAYTPVHPEGTDLKQASLYAGFPGLCKRPGVKATTQDSELQSNFHLD